MSDLVKKLRGHTHHPDRDPKLRCFKCEAADRIEELEQQRDVIEWGIEVFKALDDDKPVYLNLPSVSIRLTKPKQ